MSRSGYSDEGDQWDMIRWRGAVESAIRGKRGQAFLKEFRDALDAMPEKKLYEHELQTADGHSCALGAVGKARGIDMVGWDPEHHSKLADTFDIADALVREIEFMNDESPWRRTWTYDEPEKLAPQRWRSMREWVDQQIPKETP